MRKFILIGCVFCLFFSFTAPAMALDVDFSGYYRVRGFCIHDYETFGWNGSSVGNEHADDHFDMLLDINIVFKIHPRLRLITNFTALDKIWGTADVGPGMSQDDRNIDWNQAYMEIDTGIGQFQIGRTGYGAFNHDFMNDTTNSADSIQYMLKPKDWGGPRWNPLLFTVEYAKIQENDWGNSSSDEDNDEYRVTLGYFSTDFVVDNLLRFQRNEFEFYNNAITGTSISKADIWSYGLYAMAKFGIIQIEGEYQYSHGYLTDLQGVGTPDDIELDAMGWFIQTTLDLNQFEAYAGWAHTDGDKSTGSGNGPGDTINNLNGQFGDFDILFFLTSSDGFIANNFGGMGNWSATGNNPYGLDLLYLGGGFDLTRDINISGVWGLARADAVPTGSKKVGWETNLWLTWQIMNGLQYKALFAFFDAGQFWEDAQNYSYLYSSADDGSCWALMHQLTLSF